MNKKDDDLIGFKDFLDDQGIQKPRRFKNDKRNEDFELLTFLEQESERLDQHLKLFEEKSYMLKNYPQDIELLIQAEEQKSSLKSDAIQKLKRLDSPLMKSLAEIFNPHFRT